MLSSGGVSDEVKCEDLVKVTIEDDPEKFFSGRISTTSAREGEIGRVP